MATLGSQAVGSIVKLNVNGVLTNFIVVHQGLPGTMYDASCDGTWLLMQDIYEERAWDTSNVNDYEASDVNDFLNNTFINLLDDNIKSAIKQVKIPYRKGSGTSTTVSSGSSGLSTKIFLLSYTEVGGSGDSYAPIEGAVISYFNGAEDSKRIAYYNGTAVYWNLRTPRARYDSITGSYSNFIVRDTGLFSARNVTYSEGIRPALVMPSDLVVSDDGEIEVVKRALGYANIGSVLKNLSEKGYINKNGVVYPITTSSQAAIGGVLKSLLIGEIPSRLPSGYTEVEYIESSGTQYIDTGVIPSTDIGIEVDFMLTAAQTTGGIVGAEQVWSSNMYCIDAWAYRYGTVYQQHTLSANTRYYTVLRDGIFYQDGTAVLTGANGKDMTISLYMFALSTLSAPKEYAKARIYSCEINSGGSLVRDFVPCVEKSSGAAGMYDLVNGTFYGNSGTGTFTAGNAV